MSLPESAFRPFINITEGVVDGKCEFRAVAHIMHGRESVRPEVRERLLNHLNSDSAGYLRGVVTSSARISL